MRGLLFISVLCLAAQSFAIVAPKYSITNHKFFEFQSPNDSQDATKGSLGRLGRMEMPQDTTCMPEVAEEALLHSKDLDAGVKTVGAMLNRCFRHSYSGLGNVYLDMLGEIKTSYRYEETGRFIGIKFRDSFGRVITGHLGIKKSDRPLPLVIFKCGVNCDLTSRTTRKAMMQFFDEGPFHILAIPSMTGEEFIYANKQMGFGGFDEGRNLIEIARYVRTAAFPYSPNFSGTHIVGISLGGVAAFYAALYHDTQIKTGTPAIINSFISACPVVDMESSVREVFRNPLARFAFGNTIVKHARYIVDQQSPVKSLADVLTTPFSRTDLIYFFGQAYAEIWQLFMRDISWGSAPLNTISIRSAYDFWAYNRFYYYADYIQTPYLVWTPDDDPIVLKRENSQILEEVASKNKDSGFHFLNTDHGNHCSFATNYGWGMSGTILRSYLVRHSPDLMAADHAAIKDVSFLPAKLRLLPRGSVRKNLYMEVKPNESNVTIVSYNMRSPCDPTAKPHQNCFSSVEGQVSLDKLGLHADSVPTNTTQADTLTRWLNTNVRFVNQDNGPVGYKDNIVGMKLKRAGLNLKTAGPGLR